MMTAILTAAAPLIAPAIGTALAGLLTYGIHKGIQALRVKLGGDHLQATLDAMDTFATQAVLATEQTVVDSLKKSGQWGTPEAYAKALGEGVSTLKVISASTLPSLGTLGITDTEAYLRVLIEAKVKDLEKALATAPLPPSAPAPPASA